MRLEEYRESIDTINQEIAENIAERMEVVEKIGEYKKSNDMDIVDEGREEKVKNQFEKLFQEKNLPAEKGRELADLLIEMAVEKEREKP